MCGIVGFALTATCGGNDGGFSSLDAMSASIEYRGPDSSGSWIDSQEGIALAHRRLAITDLSAAGHQPMVSPTSRYILIFNGEIYNHISLREHLPGNGWRGHSDTETLLVGFEVWGIRETLRRCVGMFALAVWDARDKCLTLARDRFGEKPLYYGLQQGVFLFGSELKALRVHPSFNAGIDRGALTLYMRYGYIPAPFSIYKGIYKLEPGHLIELTPSTVGINDVVSEEYWSLGTSILRAKAQPFVGDDEDAVNELDARLRGAIARQMAADVPLGAFLSGGVDSSAIVALMQAQSSIPIQTFTVGFDAAGYDEAEHAKAVALHLGTKHTELYISPQTALPVIEKLPILYDEPFGDSSQIPTFLISGLIRQHVKVGISGDAGDELFGGYNRHTFLPDVWRLVRCIPHQMRPMLGGLSQAISPDLWTNISRHLMPFLPRRSRINQFGDKLQKFSRLLSAQDEIAMYQDVVSHWDNPTDLVLNGWEPSTLLTCRDSWPDAGSFVELMLALDALSYLPGDILTKVDRASMAVSLETRLPFLDHELFEFVWSLPMSMKIRNGQGKWILRELLDRYVPRCLIDRPKSGFAVPVGEWLRGPLREWAEELIGEQRLIREGYLDPRPIRKKWTEHITGRRNWQQCLWNVLMFQAWLEREHAR